MNRRHQVAINAKLQKIFARQEKDEFLSFPPEGGGGHEYGPEDLDILSTMNNDSQTSTAAALEKLCEFACLVNQAPRGSVFAPNDEDPLWIIYRDILRNAETTMDELTDLEQKAYDEAVSFLFVKEDGVVVGQSAVYQRYNEFKDRYYDTRERGGDVRTLTAEWEAKGCKSKVEKYLDTFKQLSMKYPSLVIAQERNSWLEDAKLLRTLQTDRRFAPTYMFPVDVYKQDWSLHTLQKDEIDRLVKEASGGDDSELQEAEGCTTTKITFECRSVKVDRPWLNRSILESRHWRFPQSLGMQPITCEGDDLSVGRFPAYVASLVLVRNVVVEQELMKSKVVSSPDSKSVNSSGRVDHPVSLKQQAIAEANRQVNSGGRVDYPVSIKQQILSEEKHQESSGLQRPSSSDIRRPTSNNVTRPSGVAPGSRPVRAGNRIVRPSSPMSTPTPTPSAPNATVTSSTIGVRPRADGTESVTTITKETLRVGSEGKMSVMVYICKRLPAPCPNPDAKANWLGGINTAKLNVTQTDGGILEARIDGSKVGSNAYARGSNIVFAAIPQPGYVLEAWLVNSKKQDARGYELSLTLGEEGLNVAAIWKKSRGGNGDRIQLSPDRKTLLKCTLEESDIDMNEYAEFSTVTSIGPGAFENNTTLHQIRISTQVQTIGDRAFAECIKLQQVFLPAGLLNVADSAFERKNSLNGPLFMVDAANESYASFDGLLSGRERVRNMHVATCRHCGASFFLPDGAAPVVCPRCGEAAVDAGETEVCVPDYYFPFRINEVEARSKIQNYFKKRNFVLPAFLEQADRGLELHCCYVPSWEFDVAADSDYAVKFKRISHEDVKNPDGTTTRKENVSYEDRSGHTFQEYLNVAVSASKLLKGNVVDQSQQIRKQPDSEWWNSGAALECYGVQPRQALDQFQNHVASKVKADVNRQLSESAYELHIDTIYRKLRQRLVMRPLWVGSIAYEGTRYLAFVDGDSGLVDKSTTYAIDKQRRNRTYALIAAGVVGAGLLVWLLVSLFA